MEGGGGVRGWGVGGGGGRGWEGELVWHAFVAKRGIDVKLIIFIRIVLIGRSREARGVYPLMQPPVSLMPFV